MKIEMTDEWCMNMAKIEARAEELHDGCQMPMDQARELAVSEAGDGAWRCIAPACKPLGCSMCNCAIPADVYAALLGPMQAQIDQKHAEYEDLQRHGKNTAHNLARMQAALAENASRSADYLRNAIKAEAEVAQARQTAEYWKAEHLAGNTRIGELHDEAERMRDVLHRMLEAPTTQISVTWKDAVRQALALGPNVELTGLRREDER